MRGGLRRALSVLLLLISGCAEPTASQTAKAASGASAKQPAPAEPALVLDGTDLVPLGEVELAALPPGFFGSFATEQGGAELSLAIAGNADEGWLVTRVFVEPGLPPQTRQYRAERRGDMLVAPGLTIQGTRRGILVRELDSGVEDIAAAYWIHYHRLGGRR